MPLEALTINAPGARLPAASAMTARTNWDGLAESTTSAPRTASANSVSAHSPSGSETSDRYGLRRRWLIDSAISGS